MIADTLDTYCSRHKLVLPRSTGHWHMLSNPIMGQVNAVDSTRGYLIAISDKGLGLIDTLVQGPVIGHKDWFVKDVVITQGSMAKGGLISQDPRLDEFDWSVLK